VTHVEEVVVHLAGIGGEHSLGDRAEEGLNAPCVVALHLLRSE
jgi:hypothetical protein